MTQDTVQALMFREYIMNERQALLMRVDYLERLAGISPRTSELRKMHREQEYRTDNPPPVVKPEI